MTFAEKLADDFRRLTEETTARGLRRLRQKQAEQQQKAEQQQQKAEQQAQPQQKRTRPGAGGAGAGGAQKVPRGPPDVLRWAVDHLPKHHDGVKDVIVAVLAVSERLVDFRREDIVFATTPEHTTVELPLTASLELRTMLQAAIGQTLACAASGRPLPLPLPHNGDTSPTLATTRGHVVMLHDFFQSVGNELKQQREYDAWFDRAVGWQPCFLLSVGP